MSLPSESKKSTLKEEQNPVFSRFTVIVCPFGVVWAYFIKVPVLASVAS